MNQSNQAEQVEQVEQLGQKQQDQSNQELTPEQELKNKRLYFYQRLFISSLLKISSISHEVATSVINQSNSDTDKTHEVSPTVLQSYHKLNSTVSLIVKEYTKEEENIDNVKMIKKVFYTLKDNLELLTTRNRQLFSIRNKENKLVTIIPGLNLNIIVDLLTDENKKLLWDNIYVLFITSVKLIYMNTDVSRHKKEILDAVKLCEKEIMGCLHSLNGYLMNTGDLANSSGHLTLDDLTVDLDIPGFKKNSGLLSRLLDTDNLTEEIQKFSDEDVNQTINALTKMLGDDNDIKYVCEKMVRNVLMDLKQNGLDGLGSMADRVTQNLEGQIDPTMMEKTGSKMLNVLHQNQDSLKDIKDDDGNPIGESLFNQLASTLQMAQESNNDVSNNEF